MIRTNSLLRGAAVGALLVFAACSGTTDFTLSKTFDVNTTGGSPYALTHNVDLATEAPDAWKHRSKVKKLEMVGVDATILTVTTAPAGTTGTGSIVLRPEGGTGPGDVVVGDWSSNPQPVTQGTSLSVALNPAAVQIVEDAIHGSGRFTVLLTGQTNNSASFSTRADLHLKLTYKVP